MLDGMMFATLNNRPTSRPVGRTGLALGVSVLLLTLSSCSFEFSFTDGFSNAIDGSGDVVTEEFDLDAISAVDVGTFFDVEIFVGDEQSVVVSADDNLFEHLKIEVNNGVLELGTKPDSAIGKAKLSAAVTVTQLDSLTASGASDVAMSTFDGGDLEVDVSGSSDLVLAGRFDRLAITVSGASDVDVAGRTTSAEIVVDGASNLDFGDSEVGEVGVDLSGASTLAIRNVAKVGGSIDGVSTIKVGDATSVELDTSGLSKIERD